MKNVDKYFSLKLLSTKQELKKFKHQQQNRTGTFTINSSTGALERTNLSNLTRSNEDLIEAETEEMDRYEDSRLAEEAIAANLKLLKKQKARFLRLQRILSRNVFLIPLCAVFSVLSAASIFAATLTDYYEHVNYDILNLRKQIDLENNRTLWQLNSNVTTQANWHHFYHHNALHQYYSTRKSFILASLSTNLLLFTKKSNSHGSTTLVPSVTNATTTTTTTTTTTNTITTSNNNLNNLLNTNSFKHVFVYDLINLKDHFVITRRNFFSSDNSTLKTNVIYQTYAGIWRLCNYLSEESRKSLNVEKCTFYKTENIELDHYSTSDEDLSDPARDLIRMHNAAACCIIVSYFLLVFSWGTGLAAVFTKKVPVTLATGVLNILISVFMALLLAIVHRKIVAEEKSEDCFDLKIVFNLVCSSRTIEYGYSLGLTWLALFFTTLNGICWFHITKMQKLLFTHGYYYN